jgi:hypothetical protein
MSCTITPTAPAVGPATGPGSPAVPAGAPTSTSTAAFDSAVAGAGGGAVSTLGAAGTAVAGAAGAVGPDQLVPILHQLTAAIGALQAALQPVTGGGEAVTGGGAPGGCGCSGAATMAEPAAAFASPPVTEVSASPAPAPAPPAPASVDVSKWVTGDVEGLNPDLLRRLATLGERLGEPLKVSSGHRTRAEQEALYRKYLDGTGNLAAKPGTSNHESGNAADVQVGGVNLASNGRAKDIAHELGLHFPVPGEPWHVEIR